MCCLVFEDAWTKADAIVHDVARCRETSKIRDCVENICAVYHLVAFQAGWNHARICNDKGHANTSLKRGFLPTTERLIDVWMHCITCPTIVAHEDNDRILLKTQLLQFGTD